MTNAERCALSERIATAAGVPKELLWEPAEISSRMGRVGKVARDLTSPAVLVSVIRAWIRQKPLNEAWGYAVQSNGTSGAAMVSYALDPGIVQIFQDRDPNEWVALAKVFLRVMSNQRGGA